MTTPSEANGKSLEERAKETDKEAKSLMQTLGDVIFITSVVGFSHEIGLCYSIDFDYDKKQSVDYEELERDMLIVPNGLKASVKIVEERSALKDYATKEKEVVPRRMLVVEAYKEKVTDAYEREEVLGKALKKVTAGIMAYIKTHPDAVKTEKQT